MLFLLSYKSLALGLPQLYTLTKESNISYVLFLSGHHYPKVGGSREEPTTRLGGPSEEPTTRFGRVMVHNRSVKGALTGTIGLLRVRQRALVGTNGSRAGANGH